MTRTLALAQDAEADALLDRDPLALLIGMLLDQQVPMEHAFWAPSELARRLGRDHLDAREIAGYDTDALITIFATPRALHRYPKSMAGRVQTLCAAIVEQYDGDVTTIWRDVVEGRELYARLVALPGYGPQKAQIFTALLGKQRGVTPTGWREAAGGYGVDGVYKSVADVVDPESLGKVRAFKQAAKAAAKEAAAGKG
ncbi:HhH-GPD-type base excision DNA repair protein [Pseudonocardia sp. GCM10023141]|uniref:HhH-GPD-type base excision DNA repair protein n=1 Tax=Pseudonocardia sp. GCM10023141 TaxID=3252653 RepID=UPI003621DC92